MTIFVELFSRNTLDYLCGGGIYVSSVTKLNEIYCSANIRDAFRKQSNTSTTQQTWSVWRK